MSRSAGGQGCQQHHRPFLRQAPRKESVEERSARLTISASSPSMAGRLRRLSRDHRILGCACRQLRRHTSYLRQRGEFFGGPPFGGTRFKIMPFRRRPGLVLGLPVALAKWTCPIEIAPQFDRTLCAPLRAVIFASLMLGQRMLFEEVGEE